MFTQKHQNEIPQKHQNEISQKYQTKCVIRKKSVVYVSVLSCPPDFSDDPKRRSHYFSFFSI